MNIKLVAVDLDGTLLNNEKAISTPTREAVARAMHSGIEVVISTGRNYSEIAKLLPAVPDIRYAVTCTGASVLDCRSRRQLFAAPLSPDEVREIYEVLRPFNLVFEVFADERIYISEEKSRIFDDYMAVAAHPAIPGTRTAVADFDGWLTDLDRPVSKIHMYFLDTAERDRAWDAVRELPFSVLSSDEVDLEVMARGVDKGDGLRQLTDYLNLDRSQVLAVGDSLNDKGMLEYAGTSAVMANGLPELKEMADIVADTNEEHGVAKLLNALSAGELGVRRAAHKIRLQ